MLHGAGFGEEAGARNRVFFRVKWLQPAMEGTSCVCVCVSQTLFQRAVRFLRFLLCGFSDQ